MIWKASRDLGWKPREVDVIVPHQVSNSFARKMCMLMGVPIERCILTLEEFGNCGAASVPLALSHGSPYVRQLNEYPCEIRQMSSTAVGRSVGCQLTDAIWVLHLEPDLGD